MAAVMLISSFFVIKGIPTLFESRALIVVYGNKYDDQTNGAQMAAVTEQVTSRSNLEALIQRYNLYNLKSEAELEGAVNGMRKAVKLDTKNRGDRPGFPESFTLSYRHRDPATAKQVVTDLLSIFDRANEAAARQAADESIAVNAEIAKIEDQLSSVGRQRAAASARAGALRAIPGRAEPNTRRTQHGKPERRDFDRPAVRASVADSRAETDDRTATRDSPLSAPCGDSLERLLRRARQEKD